MLKDFDEFVYFCFEHGGTLRNHKGFGEMAQKLRSAMNEYTGKCFRHRLLFIPSPSFNHNCPACYYESRASSTIVEEVRFCPACHALLEPTSTYCDNCGTEVPR